MPHNISAHDIVARSPEQRLALAHLKDPAIDIVSLAGPAGTGKTLLALAEGLEALEDGRVKKIVVFRNLHAVGGQELGYLPGSEDEKMAPWAAAITDALGELTSQQSIKSLFQTGRIEVLPLTHIRGRTLANSWVLIDEAQNLERNVIMTALTRLGRGSKVVLSWDIEQRDNQFVGRYDGILPVVNALMTRDLFAHVTLARSERSRVARVVAEALTELDG